MTPTQRELARHALGLPNKKHTTNRNYYCIGKGGDGYEEWEDLVSKGLAIKRVVPHFGGDDLFYLTIEGALLARDFREHLSREDAEWARKATEESKRNSDIGENGRSIVTFLLVLSCYGVGIAALVALAKGWVPW